MKRRMKNFKKLSIKQIKTYGSIAIMIAFSLEAFAHLQHEEPKKNLILETFTESIGKYANFETLLMSFETVIESEISVESWMTTPFDVPVEEQSAIVSIVTASNDMVIEPDLGIEDWMTTPFDVPSEGTAASESRVNVFAETVIEPDLFLEDWMSTPFDVPVVEAPALENNYCSPAP